MLFIEQMLSKLSNHGNEVVTELVLDGENGNSRCFG